MSIAEQHFSLVLFLWAWSLAIRGYRSVPVYLQLLFYCLNTNERTKKRENGYINNPFESFIRISMGKKDSESRNVNKICLSIHSKRKISSTCDKITRRLSVFIASNKSSHVHVTLWYSSVGITSEKSVISLKFFCLLPL